MSVSNSQNGQDLWVKKVFNNKRDGYFLEIGGGDGVWISNTLLLEKELGWTGILVEPTKAFERLVVNRPNCICINKCISSDYRTVTLFEIHDKGQAGISDKASSNTLLTQVSDIPIEELDKFNSKWGEAKEAYVVDAVPLASILDEAQAPSHIDYFSLDVEGHEEAILIDFPFKQYSFGCLGIENPSPRLHQRLLLLGYKNVKRIGGDTMYLNTKHFNIKV